MENENWEEVKKLAQELLEITLKTPIKFFKVENDDRFHELSLDESELWNWHCRREYLDRKLKQLKCTFTSTSESGPDYESRPEEQAEEGIDLLKSEVFHLSGRNALETKLIDRVEKNPIYLSAIYADNSSENDIIHMRERIKLRDSLSCSVLKYRDEVCTLRRKLDVLRKKCYDIKIENRALMEELNTLTHNKGTPSSLSSLDDQLKNSMKSKEKDLKKMRDRSEILRFVYQALILESGVSWADDQSLLDTMLTLESIPL